MAMTVMLLGLAAGARGEEEERAYVGELAASSHGGLELRMEGSYMHIGFVADKAALAQLDTLKVGDQVRVVFGSVRKPGQASGINKLLRARRCGPVDAQCSADLVVQRAERAESERQRKLSMQRMDQCKKAMARTLLSDPRYVQPSLVPPADQSQAWERVRAFTGKQAQCAEALEDRHRQAYLQACEQHHCGDSVGGGCDHLVRWMQLDPVFERAYQVCKAN